MPSHFVFPDTKVFGDFVLPKEIYLLECIVPLFISQPFLSGEEFSLFIVIQSYSLTTYCHILPRVSVSVSHNLIIIRMLHSVQIEKVLHHFGEILIQLENVVRL